MLTNETKNFLSEKIWIDISFLEEQLNEINPNDSIIFDFIEACVQMIKQNKIQYNPVLSPFKGHYSKAYKKIQKLTIDPKLKYNIEEILNGMKVTFDHFRKNMDPLMVYQYQQNESWHPKIKVLPSMTVDEINKLPFDDQLTIFRGTDTHEYSKGEYGQSWTISLEIAKKFAFEHYAHTGVDWFDIDKRIVLQATYHKNDILYCDPDDDDEYEVIIEPKQLKNIIVKLNSTSNR